MEASMKQTEAAFPNFAAGLAEHCWFTFTQNEGKSWWFWPQVFLGIFLPRPSSYHPPQKQICLIVGSFFQHPLEHKLSGTTGSFSLSFVSPETDLFKWYAGSTLLLKALVLAVFQALVQLSWKLWNLGLSQRIVVSPEAVFFLHFPKEFPFPGLLWRVLFISIWLKGRSCWSAQLPPGESLGCLAWSPHHCHCSHPWDQYSSVLLLLSQR